ncbi:hypothetical protein F5887DRAFT_1070332 [Amanita rubescens]|nr:hypothetical protein F5887DRAFT_1070332 [Amanita rubescens]
MTFFVQVDQPNRFSVVTSIKKNGGKISNTQTLADYAILHTQSKTFTDLLVSTLEAGKTAYPAQYKFKLGRSKKRAALHSSSSDVEELSAREHKRFNENRGRQDKKKRTPQELEGQSSRNQAVVKLEQEEVEIVLERFRVPSPTPPPAHTQQATSRGVLLGRDHLMSSQAMADRLYKKLPHHSLGSWRHYISGNMRDDVEKLRKKAAIAYRKAMQQKHPEVVKEEPRDADLNGTTFDASNTNAEEERRREEEEDLDVVCNFFAYGGGDEQIVGESEDAVWTRLGSNTPCKTANSWIEFYDKHYHVIQERYETLIGTIAQSNHPEADPGRMNIDPRLN